MDVIKGSKVKVWWFDPRNGQATLVGEFSNTGTRRFDPPALGEATDWVLVLDDASKNYPLLERCRHLLRDDFGDRERCPPADEIAVQFGSQRRDGPNRHSSQQGRMHKD
jgi:hypothetical protein